MFLRTTITTGTTWPHGYLPELSGQRARYAIATIDTELTLTRIADCSGVAVAFIGLVVVAPERVDRTMMDILTRIVTAVVAVLSGS